MPELEDKWRQASLNTLGSNTAIEAGITAAPSADPRTALAPIDVVSAQGIVTLSGRVDSPQVHKAAEELASKAQGVIEAINELEVSPDEDSLLVG